MDEWQKDILHHMWKEMKLNECITHNQGPTAISSVFRIYHFPNGIEIESISRHAGHFAELRIFSKIDMEEIILGFLNPHNTKVSRKGNNLELATYIISYGEYIEKLWSIYTMEHPDPYSPSIRQRDLIFCPRCKFVHSYGIDGNTMEVKCQTCFSTIKVSFPNESKSFQK